MLGLSITSFRKKIWKIIYLGRSFVFFERLFNEKD